MADFDDRSRGCHHVGLGRSEQDTRAVVNCSLSASKTYKAYRTFKKQCKEDIRDSVESTTFDSLLGGLKDPDFVSGASGCGD
jgi:hypothetical protein